MNPDQLRETVIVIGKAVAATIGAIATVVVAFKSCPKTQEEEGEKKPS